MFALDMVIQQFQCEMYSDNMRLSIHIQHPQRIINDNIKMLKVLQSISCIVRKQFKANPLRIGIEIKEIDIFFHETLTQTISLCTRLTENNGSMWTKVILLSGTGQYASNIYGFWN